MTTQEKSFIDIILGDRFVKLGDYKFDRLVFSSFILLSLVVFIFAFSIYGSDRNYHIYYNCNIKAGQCSQPFFKNYPVCEQVWNGACTEEFVPAGFVYGKPVPLIVKNWGAFMIGGLAFCFLLNHFWHNRGKKIEVE